MHVIACGLSGFLQVAKERNAAKFCAKPATAIICINFFADGFCNKERPKFTNGCKPVKPPIVPIAKGISIENIKIPFSILAFVKLV